MFWSGFSEWQATQARSKAAPFSASPAAVAGGAAAGSSAIDARTAARKVCMLTLTPPG